MTGAYVAFDEDIQPCRDRMLRLVHALEKPSHQRIVDERCSEQRADLLGGRLHQFILAEWRLHGKVKNDLMELTGSDPSVETLAAYEHHALQYIDRTSTARSPQVDDLLALTSVGSSVLELGCGPGADAVTLEEAGWIVDRTDGAAAFVNRVQRAGHAARLLKLDARRHFTYWQEDELREVALAAGWTSLHIIDSTQETAAERWITMAARNVSAHPRTTADR